eukprot:Skav203633  [mRNA]  locus=scaffold1120:56745:62721:+ [translate_table: standard]
MLVEGSQAFCLVKTDQGQNREIAGVVVESLPEEGVVIAAPATAVGGISTAVVSGELGFVKVPLSGVSERFPAGWNSDLMKTMPAARKARSLWFAREPEIESSEVEVMLGKRLSKPSKKGATSSKAMPGDIAANLGSLRGLLKKTDSEDEEEEDDSDEGTLSSTRFAPPGGKAQKKSSSKKNQKGAAEIDMTKLMLQQMASGASAKPTSRRIRSSAAPVQRHGASAPVVAREDGNSSSEPLPGSGGGCAQTELGSKMGRAVQELSKTPVEEGVHIGAPLASALQDPAFVERASRWRGGNYGRRVASVLAKVAKYLRIVKPEILDASSQLAQLQLGVHGPIALWLNGPLPPIWDRSEPSSCGMGWR